MHRWYIICEQAIWLSVDVQGPHGSDCEPESSMFRWHPPNPSTSLLAGNGSGADLCCSLHHSQRLHITGSAASSPPSSGGQGQSWTGGGRPRLWISQQLHSIWCHHGNRGGCHWRRNNLPAKQRVSESERRRRFPAVAVSCTLAEPGEAQPAPLHRLCRQRGPPLPSASLWRLPNSSADVWTRCKFESLVGRFYLFV